MTYLVPIVFSLLSFGIGWLVGYETGWLIATDKHERDQDSRCKDCIRPDLWQD